jgi:uncharacterized protein (DUF1684 family)
MCAAPISAGDPAWTPADTDWERLQVAAADAFAASDLAGAAASWAAALRTARASFEADDPRLATSLANHAAALRCKGEPVPSRLLEEALEIWHAAPAWLARQRFAPRARSSTFHLRLEAKHPGAYQANARRRAAPLFAEGRALTQALAAGKPAKAPGPAAWPEARPGGFDAMRKLMAAVHLLARADDNQDGS